MVCNFWANLLETGRNGRIKDFKNREKATKQKKLMNHLPVVASGSVIRVALTHRRSTGSAILLK